MSRSFIVSLVINAVLFLATAVFYLIPPLNNPMYPQLYNIGTVIYQITLIVPVVFILISYLGIERQWKGRLAWLFIFIALLVYLLGDTVWNIYDIAWHTEAPHPGIADLFYVFFYPFIILAMLRFIKVADVKLAPSEALLIGIIAVLLAAEVIGRVVIPTLIDIQVPILARIVDSFYVLADVAILCLGLVIVVQFWGGRVTTTYILFVIGIIVMTVCDAIYAMEPDIGLRNPLDLGWTASYILIALASVYDRSLHYNVK